MTGRNDPCPCGSGKKYKHCCWRKEQAAQAQNVTRNDVTAQNDVATEDAAPSPEPDPLMERINAFWEDFMDAPYEEKWALATEMLAEEPELCDAQMVFEIGNGLFNQAVTRGELDRLKEIAGPDTSGGAGSVSIRTEIHSGVAYSNRPDRGGRGRGGAVFLPFLVAGRRRIRHLLSRGKSINLSRKAERLVSWNATSTAVCGGR